MKLGGLGGKESRKIWRREKNIVKIYYAQNI